MSKFISPYPKKTRNVGKLSSSKTAIKYAKNQQEINNNSFFEENENNLYEFMKNNNFEEFEYDEVEDHFGQGATRLSKSKTKFSKSSRTRMRPDTMKSGISSASSFSKANNNHNYNNNKNTSVFNQSSSKYFNNDDSRMNSPDRRKSQFNLHMQKFKSKLFSQQDVNYNKNNNNNFNVNGIFSPSKSKLGKHEREAEIKMRLNRDIKNDKYFIDYKSPRRIRRDSFERNNNNQNFEEEYGSDNQEGKSNRSSSALADADNSFNNIGQNFNKSENADFDDEKRKKRKKKNKDKDNVIGIDISGEIKDINVLRNVQEFNKKNEQLKKIKGNLDRVESKYDYVKVNKTRKNTSEADSPSPAKKKNVDVFNNNFKENKAIRSIKNKKDIKIFEFDVNHYLAERSRISSSIFQNEQTSNKDFENVLQNNNNNNDVSELNWDNISKIRENDFSSISQNPEKFFKESVPNKAIYDKFLKYKFKWKKDEREKKLNEHKNKNSKYFNNVILLRPEIIQSQKQTQFDIFTSKFHRKNNIDYVNYILRKANKNQEEKFLHLQEIDQKVEMFAKKMEHLEKERFENFRKINELNNIHSTNNFNSNKPFSEDFYFNEKGNNNFIVNENLKIGNTLINSKKLFGKESVAENKISIQSVKSTLSSSRQKRLTVCDYFVRIYLNIKGFLITDPNKSFAEKKIDWVGKNGPFPKEFQDYRKVD